MLGWEIVEAQQLLGIIDDLGHRLGPLDAIVAGEHLDGALGVVAVGGVADLGQRRARPGLHGLGQAGEHVGELVDPVALVAGGREDVTQRCPQSKRAVTDRHHRRPHATPPQIPQQLGPRLGRLPLAIGDRHSSLVPSTRTPTITAAAQPGLLQPHPEVDAVGPDVHVVTVRQVTATEGLVVGLPRSKQATNSRG
jgi:hypothetical protein